VVDRASRIIALFKVYEVENISLLRTTGTKIVVPCLSRYSLSSSCTIGSEDEQRYVQFWSEISCTLRIAGQLEMLTSKQRMVDDNFGADKTAWQAVDGPLTHLLPGEPRGRKALADARTANTRIPTKSQK
jgi:hypothetical protein